jgi:hypothetical protein
MEKKEITKAILAVMHSVKGIDKTLTVGSGSSSYKGVSDKDVKNIIGEAMEKNGLCILPIGINAKTQVDRWVENTQYGEKTKQNVLTEVTTKYLLMHESGESIELEGYGHGVDSQDKSAGKATTYALKYTLLYTFLVPTGTIDDADIKHSDEIPVPAKELPWLSDKQFEGMKKAIADGQKDAVRGAMSKYRIKKEFKEQLNALMQ